MKKLFAAALAAVMVAVAAPGLMAKEQPPQVTQDGLVLQKKGTFQYTWLKPDVDFSQYDKVLIIGDGDLEFRDVGPARKSRSRPLMSHERFFGVSEADQARFGEVAGESFEKQLQKARNLTVVNEPGEGVLIIRAHARDVVSQVPPQLAGRGEVYSRNVGQATVVMEFYDGVSGEPVALGMERSAIARPGHDIDMMMPLNSVTAWAEVRRWASRIGIRLAHDLSKA